MTISAPNGLDGRFAQGWGGTNPNGAHVNTLLAQRGSPTAATIATTFTSPTAGFTPILACVGPDQPSYETIYPPTVLLNKMPTDQHLQAFVSGAGQLGIAQGVLDAVAADLLTADLDTLVLVSLWLDGEADDETAVRDASREATLAALREAVTGRNSTDVARLVESRDHLTHPFYGGQ